MSPCWCGSDDAAEIECLRSYSSAPISVCKTCGTVYVRERRSSDAIAADWAALFGTKYSAASPFAVARLMFVLETLAERVGIAGKSICDIGAGEGVFLRFAKRAGAHVFGIEPSAKNVMAMLSQGIDAFCGTAEAYDGPGGFDIVTLLWTLENCADIAAVVKAARRLLVEGGTLVVATGSRILVPFKKPLSSYIATTPPADTNPWRMSARTTTALLAHCGLHVNWANSYTDHDVLLVGASRCAPHAMPGDDWRKVVEFFSRWHADTMENWAA